jgi:hypothetical protein
MFIKYSCESQPTFRSNMLSPSSEAKIKANKNAARTRRQEELSNIFFSVVLPAHLGPRSLLQFCNNFLQTVGLLGRVISPSQGLYLNTGQHKHRINAYADIHVLSEIRTHDPSVRASKDSTCLRPCGYRDRQKSPTYCTVLAVLVEHNRLSHAIVHTFFIPDFIVGITIVLLQLKNYRTDCLSTSFLFGGQLITS